MKPICEPYLCADDQVKESKVLYTVPLIGVDSSCLQSCTCVNIPCAHLTLEPSPVTCEDNPDALHTSVVDSADNIPVEQKLGPSEDGKVYITPFDSTIIYLDNQYFEVTAAVLSHKAQLIPMMPGSNRDVVIDLIQYLTPTVIIMGGYFSREQVARLFERGFQTVYIFMYNSDDKNRYSNNVDGVSQPFDRRVHFFGLDELYATMHIEPGMGPLMVMEKMILARFPEYKSVNITRADAEALKVGIQSTGLPFDQVVARMAYSWKGYELEQELSLRGKVLGEFRKQIAEDRADRCGIPVIVNMGDKSYLGCAVPTTEFITEMKKAIPGRKNKDGDVYQLSVLYRPEQRTVKEGASETKVNGYYLGMSSAPDSNINVCTLLRSICGDDNAGGSELDAGGWAPVAKVHELLPFLKA